MDYQQELEASLRYLKSDKAIKSLQQDPYWPKWDSTWWHMLLLHEMGYTKEIPDNIVVGYVEAINKMPLKIFPIQKEDMPPDVDPFRGSSCHCQLGNVYQVLAARGVNVDTEVPWVRPWFLRYQMNDGGLNCDNDAYLVKEETPSSMVGTIAVFEAVLFYTNREWTAEEESFLKKGAAFLMNRQLRLGSSTKYNQAEQKSAEEWVKLCFPRYYLYDVLRGLNALLIWADKANVVLPRESVQDVVSLLTKKFPNGQLQNERHSYSGAGTLAPGPDGVWLRRQPATYFPLLTKVSEIGRVSPFLTKQWQECALRLERHLPT
jgi:hypothetical protein